jgi:hypothetical protein
MSRPMVEQIMRHQVVLQTDGQREGERENPCQLFAHHHAVPVVLLAGAAESLIDLQSVNAGFGSTGEDRSIMCWRSQSC